MSELFKDVYNLDFYNKLADFLSDTLDNFNKTAFIDQIYIDNFEALELKERMAHTAVVMHQFLPESYDAAVDSILRLINTMLNQGEKEKSIEYMFIPEYISLYGLEHLDTSIVAMENITQFSSCEFAIRPFIIRYPAQMLKQMLIWSKHDKNSVRRLASEGSRPRLPWAMALPDFKKDPTPILAILSNLKNDPCEIVRRSVANNINDISKDNPAVTIALARDWKGDNNNTDALVKHACRTLLKQSEPDVLKLFGFDSDNFELSSFKVETPKVKLEEELQFSFSINLNATSPQRLRLEYAIYYMKKNGQLSRKVFKISERNLDPTTSHSIVRKQSFRTITTRKHYIGHHEVSVIINGLESKRKVFELVS